MRQGMEGTGEWLRPIHVDNGMPHARSPLHPQQSLGEVPAADEIESGSAAISHDLSASLSVHCHSRFRLPAVGDDDYFFSCPCGSGALP